MTKSIDEVAHVLPHAAGVERADRYQQPLWSSPFACCALQGWGTGRGLPLFARAGHLLDADDKVLGFLGRFDVVVSLQEVPERFVDLQGSADVAACCAGANEVPARDLVRWIEI